MTKWKFFGNMFIFVFCLLVSIFLSFLIIQGLEKIKIIQDYNLGFFGNMIVGKYWVYLVLPIFSFLYLIFFILLNKNLKRKNTLTKKGKEIATKTSRGKNRWQNIDDLLKKSIGVLESDLPSLKQHGWILNQYLIKANKVNSLKKLINQNNNKSTKKLRNKIVNIVSLKQKDIKQEIENYKQGDERLFLIDNNLTHQLLIGSTGSGKTQQSILPQIDVLVNSKNKPSIIISDIKGEIFKKKAKLFQQNGYDIKAVNFKNFKQSSHWNPLHIYSSNWHDAIALKFYLENESTSLSELELSKTTLHQVKKSAKNINNKEIINNIIGELEESVHEGINEIAQSIFILDNIKDKYWIQMARNIFLGLTWFLLEEYNLSLKKNLYDGDEKTIHLKQINISAVAEMGAIPSKILKIIFSSNRESHYRSWKAIAPALDTRTPGERFSQFSSELAIYNLRTTKSITSNDNLDLEKITSKPTVLFIIIPDNKDAYHPLVTNLIDQIYKKLIWKSNISKNNKLENELYFILDEFGNFPKISKMETMITAARSRGIKILLGIQSYSQLNSKYGIHGAKTLIDNMDFTKYIMTNGYETAKKVSDKLGLKMIFNSSASKFDSKPLLEASDLMRLPQWTGIILASRNFPIKTNDFPDYLFNKNNESILELPNNKENFSEEKWFQENYWDIEKEKTPFVGKNEKIKKKNVSNNLFGVDLESELESLEANNPWNKKFTKKNNYKKGEENE